MGVGPNRGSKVPQKDALATACAGCGIHLPNPMAADAAEFSQMLVEWYFSGNWIKEDYNGT